MGAEEIPVELASEPAPFLDSVALQRLIDEVETEEPLISSAHNRHNR